MIVWICTDMEGLAGVDQWDQCYHPDDDSPVYQDGLMNLTAEVNAAAAGAFDAGATEVRVLDGHGRNRSRGFIKSQLDPRVRQVFYVPGRRALWEGLDESVDALAIIGQHSMAGTVNGFLDHTQDPKNICRYMINDVEIGEPSQMSLYAGHFGVPYVYGSGDEAFCDEMRRLFPHVVTTPTKRGTGWHTCELYSPDEVRRNIRRDIARSLRQVDRSKAWKLPIPIKVSIEFAYSGLADPIARIPGVSRPDARTVSWYIDSPLDIYLCPGPQWTPRPAARE